MKAFIFLWSPSKGAITSHMNIPLKSCLFIFFKSKSVACIVHMPRCFSRVLFFATSWTVAHQAPLSVGFSRQEYQSRLPFPSLGNLPNLVTEPVSHITCIDRWVLYHQHHWEAEFFFLRPSLITLRVLWLAFKGSQ